MRLPRAWLSDCVTSRFMRFLCCALLAPFVHQIRRPSRLRTMSVGSTCGLGPDLVGIYSISLAARYRVAACSTAVRQGLGKIQTVRGHISAPVFALSPPGRESSLHPPGPVAPRTLSILSVAWTVMASMTKLRRIERRKVAIGLLLDKLHDQGPLSRRASEVLGSCPT